VLGAVSLVLFALATLALLNAVGGVGHLRTLVERAGPWAPLVYVALKAITALLPPVSGTPLRIASGALFGIWLGTLYSVIGDVIGGSISFWISRLYGRRVLSWFVGAKNVEYVDTLVRRVGGWRALLFVRLVVPGIYDYASYAAGLAALPFRQYLAVTALAGIAYTAFTVGIGAGIVADRRWIAVIYGGLAVLAVLAILARRRFGAGLYGSPDDAPHPTPGHSGEGVGPIGNRLRRGLIHRGQHGAEEEDHEAEHEDERGHGDQRAKPRRVRRGLGGRCAGAPPATAERAGEQEHPHGEQHLQGKDEGVRDREPGVRQPVEREKTAGGQQGPSGEAHHPGERAGERGRDLARLLRDLELRPEHPGVEEAPADPGRGRRQVRGAHQHQQQLVQLGPPYLVQIPA
jgi:uncharacterized membrane protein YdjX (TVP38/TMEM64 family)